MLFWMEQWLNAINNLVQSISFHSRLLGDSGFRKSARKSASRVDVISLIPENVITHIKPSKKFLNNEARSFPVSSSMSSA